MPVFPYCSVSLNLLLCINFLTSESPYFPTSVSTYIRGRLISFYHAEHWFAEKTRFLTVRKGLLIAVSEFPSLMMVKANSTQLRPTHPSKHFLSAALGCMLIIG